MNLTFPTAKQDRFLDFPADPAGCMFRLYQSQGELAELRDGNQLIVFAFGPQYVHRVLSNPQLFHSRFFPIPGPKNSAQRRLTSGLLNMNGETHKRHRRMVSGPFQRTSNAGYQEGIAHLAQEMVRGWKVGDVCDISREMNDFMLRVTSQLLFGFDQPELAYEIGRATESWVKSNHEVGIGALVPNIGSSDSYPTLLKHADELEQLIRRMIDLRRASPPAQDVLSLLLQARDESGQGMTDGELIGQAAVLFGAAHLTTAHTLTWALFLLSQHPLAAEDLFAELSLKIGDAPPTFEQTEQFPRLNRILKESMRVLAASAYSQRVAAEDVELGSMAIAKGTVVVFSPMITHRLPSIYPRPSCFLPERWDHHVSEPYSYIPFASGPRLCLGSSLAMMTIKTALPTILRKFRLSVVPGSRIDARVIATMLTPTSGMPMQLSPASSSYSAPRITGSIHELLDLDTLPDLVEPIKHAA